MAVAPSRCTRLHSARRRVALLVGALALLVTLPACAEAKSNLQVGFLDNAYALSAPSAYWGDAVALNVGFARWDVQWRNITSGRPAHPRDPEDPAYDWSGSDAFMRQAAAHGIADRVMFTLWMTPTWAVGTGATSSFATQMPKLRDWRDFVHACAVRYSGTYVPPGQSEPLPRVKAWETWNEPNAAFAFRPQRIKGKPVSPRNYVRLLNALKAEVSAAVPFDPTFVAGGMYKQGGPASLTPVAFMRGLAAAHAKFDVLSMHPYNNVPRLGLRDGRGQSRTNPSFIGIGNFEDFIAIANRTFHRRYPIWITEFGLPTVAPGKEQYAAPESLQATYARGAIAKLKRLPQVERMAWFLVRDELPRDGAWYTTGLRTPAGAEKPSYAAFRDAAAKLAPSPIR